MIMKNKINVGVYGQDIDVKTGARGTRVTYNYSTSTSSASPNNDDWIRAFFDPRDARDFNSNELFAVWFDNDSIFYGIVFPTNDAGDGRKILAINVRRLISQDGSVIISTLRNLRDLYLIGKNSMKEDVVDTLLLSFDESLIHNNSFYKPVTSNLKGYRCYTSESELAQMLSYPYQSDYKDLKCIYFSPNDLKQPNTNLRLITTPIRIIYQIGEVPIGISLKPSNHAVSQGGSLTIIYHKKGCEDARRTIDITGSFDPAISYKGNTININDAITAGVKFMRKIFVDFVEEGTNTKVDHVTIRSLKGKQNVADSVSFPETERTISFTAIATGFHEKQVTLNVEDLNSDRLKVDLKPKSAEQTIEVVFPNYTKSTIRARVKQNDPLYKYLQRTDGQIHVSRQDFQKPKYSSDNYEDDSSSKTFWQKIPNWLLYAAIATIAALLIFCLWKFWPSSDENDEDKEKTKTEQVNKSEPQTQEFNEADFNADLDYMKDHEQWNKLDLKNDDFKNLIDYISNGQVSQAVAHPYKNNDKVNGHWNGILSIIEQHNNDSQFMSRVADEMRKCCKNETANIEKLHSALELLLQKNDNHTEREMTNPSSSQTHQTTNRQNPTNSNRSTRTKTNVTNGTSATNSSNGTEQRHTSD